MARTLIMTSMLVLSLVQIASAQKGASVPVMVGGEADLDACGSIGAVVGLDPNGDNFLAVRTGPGTQFDQIDSLYTGDQIHLCDRQGAWLGIVYQGGGPAGDCGVATPVADRTPYAGGCNSGWVFEEYVQLVAG